MCGMFCYPNLFATILSNKLQPHTCEVITTFAITSLTTTHYFFVLTTTTTTFPMTPTLWPEMMERWQSKRKGQGGQQANMVSHAHMTTLTVSHHAHMHTCNQAWKHTWWVTPAQPLSHRPSLSTHPTQRHQPPTSWMQHTAMETMLTEHVDGEATFGSPR